EEGEEGFRNYEYRVLSSACENDGIISTGGGIITHDDSYEMIRKTDRKVIFLNAAFESLYERISDDNSRRLATQPREHVKALYERISDDNSRPLTSQPREHVKALYDSRIERYRNAADHEVDTACGLEDTVEAILNLTR